MPTCQDAAAVHGIFCVCLCKSRNWRTPVKINPREGKIMRRQQFTLRTGLLYSNTKKMCIIKYFFFHLDPLLAEKNDSKIKPSWQQIFLQQMLTAGSPMIIYKYETFNGFTDSGWVDVKRIFFHKKSFHLKLS